MNNNQIRFFNSKLLQNKLGVLVKKLQQKASPTGNESLATLEQVVTEAIKSLGQFYKSLSSSGFEPINPIADTEPFTDDYNANFAAIADDLEVAFAEFENLETIVLGNFNYMTSRLNRLNSKMKTASSHLADYLLLSNYPCTDAIFFSDSFNNLSRIEFNSPLLNNEQLEISQSEGLLTLPIDRTKQKKIIVRDLPVINTGSNGTIGNAQEVGKSFNGDISVILDGNADTWFEYERVVSTDDNVPLNLDLTINLGSEQIINFVRINPNNFGTRTQIEIVSIDTSTDGYEFISIKDDIPIAGWTDVDEENVFVLAPATSKYAGQGLYTFTPRKAKYVRLSLRQSTPYLINTISGKQKYRYAIGLRDVYVEAQPYLTKGEIISTVYSSSDEVRKVVLLSNQTPDPATTSTLAKIDHFVSPDDGQSWYAIRPKVSSGLANTAQEVPELVDFNGLETSSISTANPVYTLRYKAVMERFPDAFTNSSSDLSQLYAISTELHKASTSTPFTLTLQHKPVQNTVKVVETNYGSRGKKDIRLNITTGIGDTSIVQLPWKPIKRVYEKSNGYTKEVMDETVYVNGEAWTAGVLSSASGTDKFYELNPNEGTLKFGNGTKGKAVPSGAVVSVRFDEERLYPSHVSPHLAELAYPTTNDKKEVELYFVKRPVVKTIILQKGARIHKLEPNIILLPIFSDTSVFNIGNLVTFVDGNTELTTDKWTYDYENGIAYSYNPTSVTTDTTVMFAYTEWQRIEDKDWDFADTNGGVCNAITISDNAWQTLKPFEPETIPTAVKYFNLDYLAPVKGTLSFDDSTVFKTEVDFIDGRQELLGYIAVTEQIPALGAGLQSFSPSMTMVNDSNYNVTFSRCGTVGDTIFVTSDAAVDDNGDYYVERSTNTVSVRLASATSDPGTITYYIANPNADLSGRYSVNYKTGEIYTYNETDANFYVDYKYTDYRIKYNIAKEVPVDDFEVDILNSQVTLKDRAILASQRVASQNTAGVPQERHFQISYQYMKSGRTDIPDLEPYFSPVLKDYALKVVTKSRLL